MGDEPVSDNESELVPADQDYSINMNVESEQVPIVTSRRSRRIKPKRDGMYHYY